MVDFAWLSEALGNGERRALSKAITLAESSRAEDRGQVQKLLALYQTAPTALRLGITGAPGVGKSTFIDALGTHALSQGARPAVLAYDPAGRRGGSILGDKTRMQGLVQHTAAFVRPSSTRGTNTGVGLGSLECIRLCEIAGFNPVIVETVGVGQSEISIADLVDIVVVLVLPNAGDELQGFKKGLLEYADLVVINKADGQQRAMAARAASEYQSALSLLVGLSGHRSAPQVVQTSAREGLGIADVWQAVSVHHAGALSSGRLTQERGQKLVQLFQHQLLVELGRRLLGDTQLATLITEIEAELERNQTGVAAAIERVLDVVLSKPSSSE